MSVLICLVPLLHHELLACNFMNEIIRKQTLLPLICCVSTPFILRTWKKFYCITMLIIKLSDPVKNTGPIPLQV